MRRGTKLHVLKAKWNEEEIVLKIPKALENHTTSWQLERLSSRFINEDFKMTKEDMIKYVSSYSISTCSSRILYTQGKRFHMTMHACMVAIMKFLFSLAIVVRSCRMYI